MTSMTDATLARTGTRLVIADALQRKMERLRAEQAACDAQRAAVVAELLGLVAALGADEAAAPAGAPAAAPAAPPALPVPRAVRAALVRSVLALPPDARGDSAIFYGDEALCSHLATAWKVCSALGVRLRCVALGADAEPTALVAHERGQSWTPGLSPLALSAVQTRLAAAADSRAAAVALGSEERYYIRWQAGIHDWVASDECSALVRSAPVESVAFGASWDSFLILFKSGAAAWAALPAACEAALRARGGAHARLRAAALGPNGEWWLGFADGAHAAGDLAPGCARALRALELAGAEVTHASFGGRPAEPIGAEAAWLLRYSERTDAVREALTARDVA